MAQVMVLVVFMAMLFVPCVLAKYALLGSSEEATDEAESAQFN